MVSIDNPVVNTLIFSAVLFVALAFSLRKKTDKEIFPIGLTQELKGLAILLIVFSHIGYSLASDERFLWPLSIMAGVGVNLFLFLSGYGLSMSGLKKAPNLKSYFNRLLKLFVPLWIVLSCIYLLDFFLLDRTYSINYIFHSLLGIFLTSDVSSDVNSVLWYFSLVLFYYLIFSIVFVRKHLWVSALIIFILSLAIVLQDPVKIKYVMRLYQVHILAFPLGILTAWLTTTQVPNYLMSYKNKLSKTLKMTKNYDYLERFSYLFVMVLLVFLIGYTAVHSNVDDSPLKEQLTSLLTMFLIILLFILKRFKVALLTIFGLVSFEIYLLHWPLISRYDFLYNNVPSWLATALYLVIFVCLGWALKNITSIIFKLKG